MRIYQNLIRSWGKRRSFAWIGRHVVEPLDRFGRGRKRTLTTTGTDFPLCYLTTTGRRSGEDRVVPLLFAGTEEAPIVTGTNFGGGHHPAWALNLQANPRGRLQIGDRERPVRARLLTEEERHEVWPDLVRIWPGYDGYIKRSGRLPHTFILEAADIT